MALRPAVLHDRGKQYFSQWMQLTLHWSYQLKFSYLKRTRNVCEYPALQLLTSVLTFNFGHLCSSGFTPTLRSGSNLSPMQQRAAQAYHMHKTTEDVRTSLKYTYLQFAVYCPSIHTNAVTLVWDSLVQIFVNAWAMLAVLCVCLGHA